MTTFLPATDAYINHLLSPYSGALTQAPSVEAIKQWIQAVIDGEVGVAFAAGLDEITDVTVAAETILQSLRATYLTQAFQDKVGVITPWDVAEQRTPESEKLFGPASKSIEVMVTVGPNHYAHAMTLPFAFGLLSVLQGQTQFTLSVAGVPIIYNEILLTHKFLDETQQFHVTIGGQAMWFSDPEFIQGIVTGAQWLNVDPKTIITDLTGLVEGERKPLQW